MSSDNDQNPPNMDEKFQLFEQKMQAQQAMLEKSQQLNTELIQRLSHPVTQNAPLQANYPLPDPTTIDPELAKQMQAMFGDKLNHLEQLAKGSIQSQQLTQLDALAAERKIKDPKIIEHAKKILTGWFSDPNLTKIANPTDALSFAIGHLYAEQSPTIQTANEQKRQFNSMGQGMQSSNRAPPIQQNNNSDKLPEYKSMKSDAEAATELRKYWEKQLDGKEF